MHALDPLDPKYVADVLSKAPFIQIHGVINVRDLGNYRSQSVLGHVTRPRYLYRSAEISGITQEGKKNLLKLGVSKIFDLRSETEIKKYNTPLREIDGIDVVHNPVFKTSDYSPEMMAKRYQLYASGKVEAFMELYTQILDHGGPAFLAILQHIRDEPSAACLFHCTAGKDRTGVISALLLKIAGVADEDIADDYTLTRVGREPARDMIMSRLAKEPLFASNNEAALNMFTCQHETMIAFLKMLDEKYGGARQYIISVVGLSDEDIDTIQKNILVPSVPQR